MPITLYFTKGIEPQSRYSGDSNLRFKFQFCSLQGHLGQCKIFLPLNANTDNNSSQLMEGLNEPILCEHSEQTPARSKQSISRSSASKLATQKLESKFTFQFTMLFEICSLLLLVLQMEETLPSHYFSNRNLDVHEAFSVCQQRQVYFPSGEGGGSASRRQSKESSRNTAQQKKMQT